jgi:hypothetical protein
MVVVLHCTGRSRSIAYAGVMHASRSSRAEETAFVLQQARHGSTLAVMIPGAREKRPVAQPATIAGSSAADPVRAAADDPGRLERAREGGGAAAERGAVRPVTLFAKLRESVLHPSHLAVIWRGRAAVASRA